MIDARIIDATVLALLDARAPAATVCPSEVARALVVEEDATPAGNWRGAMPAVHVAVDRLVRDGVIGLSWKGRVLTTRSGPYRIGRGDRHAPSD